MTGSVFASLEVSMLARRNSFQANMKTITTVAAHRERVTFDFDVQGVRA